MLTKWYLLCYKTNIMQDNLLRGRKHDRKLVVPLLADAATAAAAPGAAEIAAT